MRHTDERKRIEVRSLALRVCLVSDGFEAGFPPPSRTLVSEGTPHTRVVWAKSAQPVFAVCRVAVLGYAVKVAGLFVSLPRTRLCLSFSFLLRIHCAYLSFPFSLSPSFTNTFCLIALLTAPPRLLRVSFVLVVSTPLITVRSPYTTSGRITKTTSPQAQA